MCTLQGSRNVALGGSATVHISLMYVFQTGMHSGIDEQTEHLSLSLAVFCSRVSDCVAVAMTMQLGS